MTRRLSFRAVIEPARGGGSVVALPPEVTDALGGVHRCRVTGDLNGVEFASSTMPYKGVLYLGVHKATRESANVPIGEEGRFRITRDDRPRTVDVPPELEAALARSARLRAAFEALSFTNRKEIADAIATAKKPETKAARLAKALQRLKETK